MFRGNRSQVRSLQRIDQFNPVNGSRLEHANYLAFNNRKPAAQEKAMLAIHAATTGGIISA
jgi:hypothetical protein